MLPAPTAWPMVLAFGATLVVAGLVTSMMVTILGLTLAAAAAVGWFGEVLPEEHCESVPVEGGEPRIASARTLTPVAVGPMPHRARLPLEMYPISSGVKGGLAGGVAMAVVAMLFGLVVHGSLWYPINLVAAAFFAGGAQATTAQLAQFNLAALLTAAVIHAVTSVLVGLLYAALLPMLPTRPILFGGVVAPLLWTALLSATLGFIDPLLNARVDWPWFVASQAAFGVVAGMTVARGSRIPTLQHLAFVARAGGEGPGVPREGKTEDSSQ